MNDRDIKIPVSDLLKLTEKDEATIEKYTSKIYKRCLVCGKQYLCIERGRNDAKMCEQCKNDYKYEEAIKNAPAKYLYRNECKRRNSKVRRGNLSRQKYDEWRIEAERLRDKVLNGEIVFEEYYKWMLGV